MNKKRKSLLQYFKENNLEDLLNEWHPTKNGDLKPAQVTYGSNKKVWWVCDKGHEWDMTIRSRAVNNQGCPYCANKRVLEGYNDLTTTHPEISKYWHPTKNGDLKPTQVTYGSGKKVWWICEKGHEWNSSISSQSRNNRISCPSCNEERQTSFPELYLYYYLNKIFPDAKNRYKYDGLEIDIFIPSLNLGIEYDGYYWHKNKYKKDKEKSIKLISSINLIRIREKGLKPIQLEKEKCINHILETHFNKKPEEVLFWILNYIKESYNISKESKWYINNLTFNKEDYINIYNLIRYIPKEESLAFLYPKLAKEWHPTRNGKLTPMEVLSSSQKKVWWICENNHEWSAIISNRTKLSSGCPYCINRAILKGYNDLVTTHPEIAKEWHPTKNGDLKPTQVTYGSQKKVWWICNKGHEWEFSIMDRTSDDKKCGCIYCSNKAVLEGYNDLATTHPEIAKEWHPTKNGDLKPTQFTYGSQKKVWWICNKGHEWNGSISTRGGKTNSGCPYCSNKAVLEGYNDLATTHPEIAKEWHPAKNGDLKPTQVTSGSEKKVWWICDKGHEWDSYVKDRTSNKNINCPYCANKRVLEGYNDLVTTHPEIAKEWHPTKNGDLKPTQVTYGSGKKVWWICNKGHEWCVKVNTRSANNQHCPYCANKRVLEGYNDLVTTHPEIAKEWHPTKNGDLKPTQFTYGSQKKVWWICNKGHEWDMIIDSRCTSGQNCPYCSNKRVLEGYNDLATTHPEIAKEWHPTKNGDLKPTQFTYGSQKKVWWICNKGHEWDMGIGSRGKNDQGCPYCLNKRVLEGYNDLTTTHPEIAKEWHPTKNGDLKPTQFTYGSQKKVWWICEKGHEYEKKIYNKILYPICSVCKNNIN